MWLIGAVVCLCVAPRVQLFASADNGCPHNAPRYHQLMPINCHFRDCKALLVTSLDSCKQRCSKYPTFTFTVYRIDDHLTYISIHLSHLLFTLNGRGNTTKLNKKQTHRSYYHKYAMCKLKLTVSCLSVAKKLCIALHWKPISELRGVTCHNYGITQYYLPPDTSERAPP